MEGRKVVQSPITDIQKECILLNTSAAQNILKGSGITNYEPAVLNQLLTVANCKLKFTILFVLNSLKWMINLIIMCREWQEYMTPNSRIFCSIHNS